MKWLITILIALIFINVGMQIANDYMDKQINLLQHDIDRIADDNKKMESKLSDMKAKQENFIFGGSQ
jgi:1,4-dihydroxy-2-naphthoate octaprenyltransferase